MVSAGCANLAALAAVLAVGCGRIDYERIGKGDGDPGRPDAGGLLDGSTDAHGLDASTDALAVDANRDALTDGSRGMVCRDSGSTVCSSSNSTLTRFANSRLGTQTTDGADNFTGSCGGAEASDVGRQFTVLDDGRYEFSVENATFDAIVYILEGNDCTGPERGCGKRVQVPLRNGDRVVAVLDGANGLCGSVTLRARFLEPL